MSKKSRNGVSASDVCVGKKEFEPCRRIIEGRKNLSNEKLGEGHRSGNW